MTRLSLCYRKSSQDNRPITRPVGDTSQFLPGRRLPSALASVATKGNRHAALFRDRARHRRCPGDLLRWRLGIPAPAPGAHRARAASQPAGRRWLAAAQPPGPVLAGRAAGRRTPHRAADGGAVGFAPGRRPARAGSARADRPLSRPRAPGGAADPAADPPVRARFRGAAVQRATGRGRAGHGRSAVRAVTLAPPGGGARRRRTRRGRIGAADLGRHRGDPAGPLLQHAGVPDLAQHGPAGPVPARGEPVSAHPRAEPVLAEAGRVVGSTGTGPGAD